MFGAPVRRIDSWIKHEGPDGREFALEMRGEPLDVRRATRSVKPFGEAGDQVSAGDRQAMCGDDTGQVAGADGERLLQDRLHVGREGGVRVIGGDQSTPAQQMGETGLMSGGGDDEVQYSPIVAAL